jgi:hypothetical protein
MINLPKVRAKTIRDGKIVEGFYFQSPLTDEDSGVAHGHGWHFLSDGINRHCISQNGVVYVIDPETLELLSANPASDAE